MKRFIRFSFIVIPVIALILFLFNACENQPTTPDSPNSVSGTLVDEQGTGVASATISIYNASVTAKTEIAKDTTDENGKFSLTQLPADLTGYKVRVYHPDFVPIDEDVSNFKTKTSKPVQLCHQDTCKGVIKFYILKSSDSSKLTDAVVMLYRDGSLVRKGLTKDGLLIFTNVCPGDYVIKYSKYHFESAQDTVTSASDTVYHHKYLVQTTPDSCCNGKIVVTVKDSATNNALSSVKGYLTQNNSFVTYSYSDSTGRIELNHLCPGDYTLTLIRSSHISKTLNFTLNCNDSAGASTTLSAQTNTDTCCKGVLKVFLIDKSTGKSPAKSVTVNLVQNGKVIQTVSATAYAYFSKLCEGNYQVQISSSNYESLKFDYTSHCNAMDTTTKYLTATSSHQDSCCHGVIDVVYKDSTSSNPLKGVSVYLYLGGSKIAALSTDANGNVHFTGLCEGDYTIKSSLSNYNNFYFNLSLGCNDTVSTTKYLSKIKTVDSCCTGKLNVTVLDSTNGNPVAGATVYMLRSNGTSVSGTTDSNGVCTFTGVCAPASYTVKATKSDYNHNYTSVSFHTCNEQNVTIKILKK